MRLLLLGALITSLAPSVAAAQWRTTLLPVIGSAPETGGQFGVALFRTREAIDSLGTRPSSLIGNAVLTTKGQQRAFLEFDRWTTGNERRTLATVIVSRFPLPFWGTGTYEYRLEEPVDYEPVTLEFGLTRQRKIGRATWRSLALRAVDVHVDESYSGIDLSCDIISPSCPFPPADSLADYGLPLLSYPYRMLSASLGIVHDTRDGLFAATRGKLLDISLGGSAVFANSEISPLLRLRVDARGYRPMPNGAVLGAQLVLQGNDGEPPIDQMALVGHHSLNRGYTMGRYRDAWMAAGQMEWRSRDRWWGNRLSVAGFGGAAFIGPSISQLYKGEVLPSGGGGIRFRLDPRTRSAIRVDYAFGAKGQSGLYVAFNEAF